MTPREKIAAIFAKARSTTSPHERDNAVTLGTRLAEKAGLSLDLFDVPGRVKARPARPTMTVHGSYSGDDMAEAEAMARATEKARAQQAAYRAGRQSPICRECGSRTTNGVRHECPASARK